MQDLSSLIRKSLDGSASEAELKELLRQLDLQEPQLRAQWMQEAVSGLQESQPAAFDYERIRMQLQSEISAQSLPTLRRRASIITTGWFKGGVAAAAMLGIALLGNYLYRTGNAGVSTPLTAQTNSTIKATSSDRFITLPDSSEVVLFAGSTLRFEADYNTKERKLLLNGKARFTVKQDKLKPFSVVSQHLVTTALGTAFEVWERNDSTTVLLLNGKVSVLNYNATDARTIYLTPGEQAVCYKDTHLPTLPHQKAEERMAYKTAGRKTNDAITEKLSFRQMPLNKVFNTLQKKYKVPIVFDSADIAGIMFTGTFDDQEQLGRILQSIANINNLEISTSEEGFLIKR